MLLIFTPIVSPATAPEMLVDVWECKYNIKDSASAKNISVAFHREYFRYHYLYFTIGKQWNKYLLSNKGISISQHTSMARAGVNVMIGFKHNNTQGIDH